MFDKEFKEFSARIEFFAFIARKFCSENDIEVFVVVLEGFCDLFKLFILKGFGEIFDAFYYDKHFTEHHRLASEN